MAGYMLALAPVSAREVAVRDSATLAAAIADARPGDDIVLANGFYPIRHKLRAMAAGPVTVRADQKDGAHILSSGLIAFEVTAPGWHFANLDIRGVCADDTICEHAFHVVGRADGFQLTGSRLVDFNAQIKVNADPAHNLPANGLIDDNIFFDSHPRHTDNPVAPVNIDNALSWVVRGNLVHDFQKDGTGEGSYGIFVKGGSQNPIIERNIIICASDAPPLGEMVGLSFGAHGMDANLCPPYWDSNRPCAPEVTAGIMRNNIVRNCTGDGIYLNKSAKSQILFNTLERTAGIEFRYPASTGVARGNLAAGIGATEGGHFTDGGNAPPPPWPDVIAGLAAGRIPAKPGARTIMLARPTLPGPDPLVAEDFCGRARGSRLDMGAVQTALGPCTAKTAPR
jgi:parallel beta-helix repeat protein